MTQPKHKTMKVFDCQDMPERVKATFFDSVNAKNGNYVLWRTYDECVILALTDGASDWDRKYYTNKIFALSPLDNVIHQWEQGGLVKAFIRGHDVVSDWLFDNGVGFLPKTDGISEDVLIRHWW